MSSRLRLLASLFALATSALAFAGEPPAVDALVKELQDEAVVAKKTPQELVAAYGQVLDELLPKMATDKIPERQAPEQTLQALCWRAGRSGAEAERAAVCKAIAARLTPDLAKPARVWLVKQLLHIGRAEAVDALAALLKDPEMEVRDYARRALQNNPSPEAGESLLAALQAATTPDWRIALLNAIRGRRDPGAASAAAKLAAAEDEGVRVAALDALALLGDKSALDAIAAAMAQGSARARRAATNACLLLAERLCAKGDKATALGVYRKLLDAKGHVRCAAIIGLGKAGGPEELEAIFQAFADEDARVRGAASEALALLPAGKASEALAARVKSAPPVMKVALLRILAERGDKSALPTFLAAATDPNESVRVAALEGLGALRDPSAAETLVAALVKAKGFELETARNAIGAIPGDPVTEALVKALSTAGPKGRAEAVKCLASRKGTGVVPTLLKTVEDEDATVRAESLKALTDLADEKALPLFVKLLVKATQAGEAQAAQNAIAAIARRVGDADKCVEPLLAAYRDANVAARGNLLRTLGRVAGAKALGAVRAALKDEDAQTQEAAFRTLVDWPDGAAAPDLLDLAKGSPNQTRRVLALRGYVRVLGLLGDRPADEMVKLYEEAMEAARRTEDKKLVLAGMAGVANLGALKTVAKYIEDEALRDEAVVAQIKIAKALIGSHREEAAAALRQAIGEARNKNLAKEAREALGLIEKFDDYIAAWEVSGPYTADGKDGPGLFDVAFPPEKADAKDVKWKVMPVGTTPDKPWLIELDKALGGNDRVAYLRTHLWSPKKQEARLELGSDDGAKVWLNGKLAHANNATRPCAAGQDQARVTLEEGWNTLLVKITQGGGEWSVCLRFRAPDGARLAGLKAQIDGK